MCCACGMSPGWEKKIKKRSRDFFSPNGRAARLFFHSRGRPLLLPRGRLARNVPWRRSTGRDKRQRGIEAG